uniref:Uncharacterized protein n=1 Tax=Rhizophora mucronata TaxID=61149 RepID=A0A2P2R3V0_RHIMU
MAPMDCFYLLAAKVLDCHSLDLSSLSKFWLNQRLHPFFKRANFWFKFLFVF